MFCNTQKKKKKCKVQSIYNITHPQICHSVQQPTESPPAVPNKQSSEQNEKEKCKVQSKMHKPCRTRA